MAAPGPRTPRRTSYTARLTRPPTHCKAMPPTTTLQVRPPPRPTWAGPPSKAVGWLLKVPPLLIGRALCPGPPLATSPLIGCLKTAGPCLIPCWIRPLLPLAPPVSFQLVLSPQPPNPTFSSRLFLLCSPPQSLPLGLPILLAFRFSACFLPDSLSS